MHYLNKLLIFGCALALVISTSPLNAGDHSSPGSLNTASNSNGSEMNQSQSSVLLTALISAAILIMPVAFSAKAIEEGIEQSGKASTAPKTQGCDKPCCGHQLPEMEVQHIGYNDQGQRQVLFAEANNPQQLLVLLWLNKTSQDPAAGFTVGQAVYFQPSAQFSGCLIHDAAGTALAFVPAGNSVVQINYSETF